MRTLAILILVAAIANVASALTTMEVIDVDNSAVPKMADHVTQDLVIMTNVDWLGAQLVVDLDEPGKVYQDELGNFNPQSPNPAFFSAFPSLEFDTYVSNGVLGESVSTTGAVYLAGPATAIFDADHISIAWYTDATDDIGTFPVARVTLHDSAGGTWSFQTPQWPAEGAGFLASGPVINGHMVPEPTTIALLGLSAAALIRGKRRKTTSSGECDRSGESQ